MTTISGAFARTFAESVAEIAGNESDKRSASVRFARVLSVGNGVVDVLPIGGSTVLQDVQCTGTPQVGGLVPIQTVRGKKVVLSAAEAGSGESGGGVTIFGGSGGSLVAHTHSWGDILNKPSTFPPSAHTHTSSDIGDFAEAAQDSVGSILNDSYSISLTYNDAANTISGALRLDGTTLTIGANGVKVTDSTFVAYGRQVIAGAGLTGGGALGAADVTLNIGAGTLITVAADSVGLSNGAVQYQVPMTGPLPYTPAWTTLSTLAGDGIAFSAGFLANIDTAAGLKFDASSPKKIQVNLGTGLSFSTGAIVLAWSGTPTTIQPDDAAAGGSSSYAARVDHAHAIVAAAPGAIQPDDTAAEGSATSFARSDHRHSIAAGTASTQAIGDAAAEGVATSFARSDHKHAMPAFATPAIVLGTAAAAGSAATLLRSDATIVAFDATVPTTIQPDDAAAAGSAAVAARRDHKHAIVAAAPGANSVNLSASAEGSGTSFARADHAHQLDVGIVPTWTGAHTFNAGATIAAGQVLAFGADVNLYRTAANILKTDDTLEIVGSLRTREHLRVLNKAGDGWVEWATRDTSGAETLYTLSNLNGVTAVTGTLSGDLRVATNVLYVNASGQRVGINCTPDAQFDLDVGNGVSGGNIRAKGYIVGKHALQVKGALMICHYDGKPPVATDFSGEPNGHMGQVATVGGGAVYRAGKFGKALQTGEATTNLVLNPSFETNATSWVKAGTGTTITRITTDSYVGSACLQVAAADVGGAGVYSEVTTRMPVTAGTSYTWSLGVKAVSASTYEFLMRIAWYDAGGSALAPSTSSAKTATTAWGTYSYTAVAPAGATTAVVYLIRNAGGTATYNIDAVQFEALAYPTPYCDGSLGTGHTWSGTAHASTSARTAASLRYLNAGNISAAAGTIMAWVKPSKPDGYAPASTDYDIIAECNYGSSGVMLGMAYGAGGAALYGWAGGSSVTGAALAQETWSHVALTWDGSNIALYINGALADSDTQSAAVALGTDTLNVGVWDSGSVWGGTIDEFALLDRAATAGEILAVYESDAPVFAETSTWMWRTANNIVWADEQGLWMIDTAGNAVLGAYGDASATKSWGGRTLEVGDVLIGRNSAYMHWDNSAGTLQIAGALAAGTVDIGGADATSFHVDVDGQLWLGAAAYADAPFKVSAAGVVTAISGTIGGWTLGAASLIGGNATLHNTGYALFGTSNDIARVDAADATYRLWVGHATAGSAPFRVTKAGAMTATGATITGAISAATIDIGGADTTSFHVDINGNLWLGAAAFADGPFRVTNAGAVTATSATITGAITASSGSFTGALSIGASGGIYQGSGTFASPTTGLKIWNDSGIGRIGGYAGGALQWYADTDGTLKAGGGNVILRAGGVGLQLGASSTYLSSTSLQLLAPAAQPHTYAGDIGGWSEDLGGGDYQTQVWFRAGNTLGVAELSESHVDQAVVGIEADAASGKSASLFAYAYAGSAIGISGGNTYNAAIYSSSPVLVNAQLEVASNSIFVASLTVKTGLNVGTATGAGAGIVDVSGVYKVDGVQVVSNRVVDARCDDTINTSAWDATTAGVLDALRDAMITHGLIAAA